MDTQYHTQPGVCPYCRRPGRLLNFIVDENHPHADPEGSGAYAVCDADRVYWYMSSQFHDFIHLESKEAVQHNAQRIREEYFQVNPYFPKSNDSDSLLDQIEQDVQAGLYIIDGDMTGARPQVMENIVRCVIRALVLRRTHDAFRQKCNE
jgi:hypothetical protein